MDITYIIITAVISFSMGVGASMLVAFYHNKTTNPEEKIKKLITKNIKKSMKSLNNRKLIGFNMRKFKKSIDTFTWQEFKKRLIKTIEDTQDSDIKPKIDPERFMKGKTKNDFTDKALRTYEIFCEIFIINFIEDFDSDIALEKIKQPPKVEIADVTIIPAKQEIVGESISSLPKSISNEIANSFYRVALRKFERFLFKEALDYGEMALDNEVDETEDRAKILSLIGNVYFRQGDYDEALGWYGRALVVYEKLLGTDHPDTATTYNNMASVFRAQGDYDKALEWYGKDLTISEKVLGAEHPDTATTYNNMASVFRAQGDYDKALEWYRKALVVRERVLGIGHPDTATTYNNMAMVFRYQGNYDKSLEWYQKGHLVLIKKLGANHPDTVANLKNMKYAYDEADLPQPFDEWLASL
ncbi:MAG: tetratricopeptide repeat protein [Defluviitaleaceae bacterium]|nr:tetratricopeptide repeat protein [Defluviitaleaceae bacterium]